MRWDAAECPQPKSGRVNSEEPDRGNGQHKSGRELAAAGAGSDAGQGFGSFLAGFSAGFSGVGGVFVV